MNLIIIVTNIMKLEKKFIRPEVYFMSDKYIGILVYFCKISIYLLNIRTTTYYEFKKFYLVNKLKKI